MRRVEPAGVLGRDQLADRAAAVAGHARRAAADRVEQLAVAEQEPVHVALGLALDQQARATAAPPRRRARRSWSRVRTPVVVPEPQAPPVGFTTQGVGVRSRNSIAPFSFDGVELVVLGQRQAGARQDLVHGGLVERQPQRDGVVERHPVAPHARARSPARSSKNSPWITRQLGADLVGRPLPDHAVGGLARVAGERREAAPPRGGAGARSARRSSAACRGARPARGRAVPPQGVSVDGEWPFDHTLRHLVLATDGWLGKAILRRPHPFHRLGVLFSEAGDREAELGIDADATPSYEEVLEARAERMAMVRDYLAAVTSDDLAGECADPWGGAWKPSVLECLRVIFDEEWHHHRYAVRDLDAIDAGLTGQG